MGLKLANKQIIKQVQTVINQFSDSQYTESLYLMSGASIGQHIRHVLEFYQCVLKANNTKQLSYDKRERNMEVEANKTLALDCFDDVAKQIATLDLNKQITLEANFSIEPTSTSQLLKTSIARELIYCLEHTIHHLAIIKLAVKQCYPHVVLEKDLGVAPSTIRYRKKMYHA